MLIEKDKNYFINNPIFVKYKIGFDFAKFSRVKSLKSVFINERIIEIPFAISCLEGVGKENRVLDVGCTESVLPLNVACLGYKVMGLDYRPYPYCHPNLTVAQGDILKLPFKKESFGAIFCISTIEHVGMGFYQDPQGDAAVDKMAVEEMRRVLKTHGLLVITVPFGVSQINAQQRVYNEENLRKLLTDFKIREERFFANFLKADNQTNFWKEVDRDEARRITSENRTECVCLLKAFKP